ncbi:O-acetyl-ADP-ribose deacetylase [Streptomyces alboniger]
MPWTAPEAHRATTVQIGADSAEIGSALRAASREGRAPDKPFMITVQPSVVDPAGPRPASTCSGPTVMSPTAGPETSPKPSSANWSGSPRASATASSPARPPDRPEPAARNANYVGGDIASGAVSGLQILLRPKLSLSLYCTPHPAVFICSSATPARARSARHVGPQRGEGRLEEAAPDVTAITLVQGDITRQQPADAIVNAANSSLLGGGGVDGAIHRRGGPAILADCRKLRASHLGKGLATGQAVATTAGELDARWVIHTVGPRFSQEEDPVEPPALRCRESLRVADELGARTVAFPAVSAGIYGWPMDDAARIAVETVARSGRTSKR